MMDQKIHHIGFIVENLEESLTHFENMYGWKADSVYEFRPLNAWSFGKRVSDYCLKIAMIEGKDTAAIEVIQPVSGEGYHKHVLGNGRSGYDHICICVTDYDEWRKSFVEDGRDILFEAEAEDELFGYRRCMYVEDRAGGMICEIKEQPCFRNKSRKTDFTAERIWGRERAVTSVKII